MRDDTAAKAADPMSSGIMPCELLGLRHLAATYEVRRNSG